MYSTLIRKELLHNMMTLRFALVTVLLVILCVSATSIRSLNFNRLQQAYAQALHERNRLDRDNSYPMWNRQYLGHTVERPPNPLSVFVGGVDQEMTRSIRFIGENPHKSGDIPTLKLGRRSIEIPSMRIFYTLDMATVIMLICSLLALLMVFDTVSAERESGTLKVIMAGPIPRDIFILAKLIAGFITILIPLALAWTGSIVCALFLMKVQFSGGDIARLGSMALLSILYTGVFFTLGMTASVWSRSSATALGFCLILWIVLGLAIPNLAPIAVRHFYPIPSSAKIRLELISRERTILSDKMPGWQKELAMQGLTSWSQQFPELARLAEKYLLAEFSPYIQFQHKSIARQITAESLVARISPSAIFLFTASTLTGTGSHDYLKFLDDVEKYRASYIEARHAQWLEFARTYNDFMTYDPDKWPVFISSRLDAEKVFNLVWLDFVILSGLLILMFFIAYAGFIRMDLTQ